MSESIADRLSQFTPDAGGLNRDRLLFEAGRASARPRQSWAAVAGVLAACQLATLVLLWPPAAVGPSPAAVQPVAAEQAPAGQRDVQTLWQMQDQALASEGNLLPSPQTSNLTPSAPPLHAHGAFPSELLN